MEAIVVAPIPPPAHQAKNVTPEQGDSDSTFAPTLSQELSKKKASEQNQSPADKQRAQAADNALRDSRKENSENSTAVDDQAAVTAVPAAHEDQPQTTNAGRTDPANAEARSALQAHLTAGQKEGVTLARSQTPPMPLPDENVLLGVAKTTGTGLVLSNTAGQKNIFNAAPHPASLAADQTLQERTALFSASAVRTGSVQAQSPQTLAQGLQGQNSLEMMQHNDYVAWSRMPSERAQAFMQQPLSIAFAEETALTSNPQTAVSTEKLLAGLSQIAADGNGPVSLRTAEQISLRHGISGQFLQTKIETADAGGEQKNAQQFLDGESSLARQMSSTTTAKPADSSLESSFSQSLSQAGGDKIAQGTAVPMRPGALPFSTVVSENEILQQVVNRFRISQHMQDSKITMRLHPAELGNLKIDIHLKDGTLNANIVAQSQQVHEILDKNMPRLRALMEQQGLELGDIIIKIDSDVPSENSHFDQQLAEHSFFSEQNSKRSRAVFTMEPDSDEEELAEQTNDSGVNVKI